MRVQIRVVYDDGREEVVEAGRPAALIAFADEFNKVAPDGPSIMREATWLAHRASDTELPFEEWLQTVAEIDRPKVTGAGAPAEEGTDATPTATPTATGSPA